MEKDDEVSGNGNIYDYGFRIYNPRLGKFLSVDPLANNFPYYTPYQFAGNKPIEAIDIDGLEELSNKLINNVRFIVLMNVSFKTIIRDANSSLTTAMQKADNSNQTDFSINGQQYEPEPGTDPDYFTAFSPQDNYQSQGQNVEGGEVVEGRSSPQGFYIAISNDGNVSSGQGDPPPGSQTAFGGGVPVVINGKPYGEKNIWKDNTPETIVKNETGKVSDANMEWLKQKSSSGYSIQNQANDIGKSILGYNSIKKTWILVSQEDETNGLSMDQIRDRLIKLGYDHVISFDGSSSATLVKDKTIINEPLFYKDNTAPVGIQLSVPNKK